MTVTPISYKQAKPFILDGHYAHRMPQVSRAFGLVVDGAIVGVVTFGQPASPWVKRSPCGREWEASVWELNRLVVGNAPKNGASTLIGGALRQLGDRIVVSYADRGAGHVGYVYQATNWLYCGVSKARTDKFSASGHSRHYAPGETARVDRSPKHRYVTFTGRKQFKAAARASLKWVPQPYPKGHSERHDVAIVEAPIGDR